MSGCFKTEEHFTDYTEEIRNVNVGSEIILDKLIILSSSQFIRSCDKWQSSWDNDQIVSTFAITQVSI